MTYIAYLKSKRRWMFPRQSQQPGGGGSNGWCLVRRMEASHQTQGPGGGWQRAPAQLINYQLGCNVVIW